MLDLDTNKIEIHPLEPFLPKTAKILFLGSFPPPKERWSMNFFYPNFQNDMWRIMATIFHNNKKYFDIAETKKFDYDKILKFCLEKKFAFFDTAFKVKRLKNNASDKFLEVIEITDIYKLLSKIPNCKTVITTGEKSTELFAEKMKCEKPKIGQFVNLEFDNRILKFYRMPSSSRAYPLALEKKAAFYKMAIC